MAHINSNLHPTVEEVLAEAAKGPPQPIIECSSVEEAIDEWGAEPNEEMDAADIDGWEGDGERSAAA